MKKIVMVQRDDGTHAASAEYTHSLSRPGFRYSRCMSAVDELNGEKRENACKKIKSASAPGADGWRVAELQALLLQLFEKLAASAELGGGNWHMANTAHVCFDFTHSKG